MPCQVHRSLRFLPLLSAHCLLILSSCQGFYPICSRPCGAYTTGCSLAMSATSITVRTGFSLRTIMATLSLCPLDSRCVLLTNIVWDSDGNGTPCLHRQKLW